MVEKPPRPPPPLDTCRRLSSGIFFEIYFWLVCIHFWVLVPLFPCSLRDLGELLRRSDSGFKVPARHNFATPRDDWRKLSPRVTGHLTTFWGREMNLELRNFRDPKLTPHFATPLKVEYPAPFSFSKRSNFSQILN